MYKFSILLRDSGGSSLLLCLWLAFFSASALAQTTKPLSLADAIALTIRQNPTLYAFGFEMRAQDGRILQAGLTPQPSLKIDLEDALGTGEAKGLSQAQASISITWVIEGELRQRRIDVARLGSELLADQAQIMRLDAAAQTARFYTLVLEQQLHRDIADAALALANEMVTAVQRRVEAGTSNAAELARVQAELAKRALYREDIDHEISAAEHRLAAQWGDLTPQFESLIELPTSLPQIEPFETLLARVEQTPDLQKFLSETRLQESMLRLQQQRARTPWQFGAGIRRMQGSRDFGVLAEVNIPLNYGDRNQGNIRVAQEDLARTAAQREAALLGIQTRLLSIHLEMSHSLHRAAALQDEVIPRFEDALGEIRRAYELGSASYLERLQVQEELLNARSELAETIIQAHLDMIEIERITGVQIALPNEGQ